MTKTLLRIVGLVLAVSLIGGCLPLSVQPLYQSTDATVQKDRLLGTWRMQREGEQTNTNLAELIGTWTVEKSDEPGRYKIRATDKDGNVAIFHGALVQLGDRMFLDLQSGLDEQTDANPWVMFTRPPAHAFVRIEFQQSGLRIATVNWRRFTNHLESADTQIDHVWFRDYFAKQDDEKAPLITAETPKLRAFVKNQLTDDRFFTTWHTMQRVKGGDGQR
jgi:hypothetical protein